MSNFSDFVSQVDAYMNEKQIKLNSITGSGYGWKIGINCKLDFQKHLDEEESEAFTDEVKNTFKNTFETGNDLLGINVLGTCGGTHADKIYLYKITESNKTDVFDNVDYAINKQLLSPARVQDPITNLMLYWKYALKPQSLSVKDSKNQYTDVLVGEEGTFVRFENGVSVCGSINYKTAQFKLSRVSDDNVKLTHDTFKQYNDIIDTKTIPGVSSSSNGSSGSSSSGSSSTTGTLPPKAFLENDKYEVSYQAYTAPLKVIWEYTMPANEVIDI